MSLLQTPDDYLYHLEATNPADAKRLWKRRIKAHWNDQCAYCGSRDELTLDHIVPKLLGGQDVSQNVLCACRTCNASKGHEDWIDWYRAQEFYSAWRFRSIFMWVDPPKPKTTMRYRPRNNRCYAK